MTWRLELRHGKEVLVYSTMPSKKIRRAKRRIEKRQREIYRMFGKKEVGL